VVIETITGQFICFAVASHGQQACCVFELDEKIVVIEKKAIDGAVENSTESYESRQERRSRRRGMATPLGKKASLLSQ
jgi:hypothetical protein